MVELQFSLSCYIQNMLSTKLMLKFLTKSPELDGNIDFELYPSAQCAAIFEVNNRV